MFTFKYVYYPWLPCIFFGVSSVGGLIMSPLSSQAYKTCLKARWIVLIHLLKLLQNTLKLFLWPTTRMNISTPSYTVVWMLSYNKPLS
jgi:hypothetical protein